MYEQRLRRFIMRGFIHGRAVAAIASVLLLVALSGPSFATGVQGAEGVDLVGTYSLQVLHSSDNESSFQDPNTLEPKILHYGTVIRGLRQIAPNNGTNSIYVTAGDHTLPGPFYQAAAEVDRFGAPGIGDIAMYNAMGLVGNGMGNHEFDGGINDFARMLNQADYPFLAVNLDFRNVQLADGAPEIEIGEDGASVQENAGKVARSAYVEVGGERIGLIGRAPADFFNVISDPDETIPGLDFYGGRNPENNQPRVSAVDQVMEQVDVLHRKGINKIVLLDHAQDYTADPLAASQLRGIDILVTAGATGFMARPHTRGPFNLLRDGDTSGVDYPTILRDRDGHFVVNVNSGQLYRYVGHLIVTFNSAGHIISVDSRSGPVATTEEAISELEGVVGQSLSVPGRVQAVYDDLVDTPTIQTAFEEVGTTEHPLDGARANVRGRETNLGRLAADSTLWYARRQFPDLGVDVALKNGGGIRASITGPTITRLTVETALAFNNQTAVVELTGDELLAAMENAVSRVPAADGRFPQIAGMVLEYNASNEGVQNQTSVTTPSRVVTLRVTYDDGSTDTLVEDGEVNGNLSDRRIVMATNDFLLTGGDGYRVLQAASEERGAERTEIGEQQVLVEYLQEALGGTVDIADPPPNPRVRRLDQ
jgi:2',3'-cyclic-nucleotide 2'-phosphodiesterase (5'-nucleotidase family)